MRHMCTKTCAPAPTMYPSPITCVVSEPVCDEGPVGEGENDEVRCWKFQGDITVYETGHLQVCEGVVTGACVLLGAIAVCTSMGH